MWRGVAALVLLVALVLPSGCGGDGDQSGAVRTTVAATTVGEAQASKCAQAFDSLAAAVGAGAGLPRALQLSVRSCESNAEWRATAEKHPAALGGLSPDAVLAMGCAPRGKGAEARPACTEEAAATGSGAVSGKVTMNGRPVANEDVSLTKRKGGADLGATTRRTTKQGTFAFRNVKPGEYTVEPHFTAPAGGGDCAVSPAWFTIIPLAINDVVAGGFAFSENFRVQPGSRIAWVIDFSCS